MSHKPSLPVPVASGSAPLLPTAPSHNSLVVVKSEEDGSVTLTYRADAGLSVPAQLGVLGAASLGLAGGGLYLLGLLREWLTSGSAWAGTMMIVASGLVLVATGSVVLRLMHAARTGSSITLQLTRQSLRIQGPRRDGGVDSFPRTLARSVGVAPSPTGGHDVKLLQAGAESVVLAPGLSAQDAQYVAEVLRRYGLAEGEED